MTFDRFEKSWKFIHLDYFGTGLFYVAVKRTVKDGDYIHVFLSFFLFHFNHIYFHGLFQPFRNLIFHHFGHFQFNTYENDEQIV